MFRNHCVAFLLNFDNGFLFLNLDFNLNFTLFKKTAQMVELSPIAFDPL